MLQAIVLMLVRRSPIEGCEVLCVDVPMSTSPTRFESEPASARHNQGDLRTGG